MQRKLGYSPNEAAEVAGVGRTSIFELIKDGKLPVRKFGRRTIILHEDLQALLKSLPIAAPKSSGPEAA